MTITESKTFSPASVCRELSRCAVQEHAAGAGCGVVDGADDVGLVEVFVVGREQQVHHEVNDLARGEVLTGGLVGRFRELADEFLEDEAHLCVGDVVGVQVHAGELLDDEEEQVVVVELLDALFELVLLEDVADVVREAADVVEEVVADVVGVAGELGEVIPGGVVEGVAGLARQEDGERDGAVFPRVVLVENLALGLGEDRIDAAQDRERQDDGAILVRAVRAPKQVRDVPDEVGVVVGCC